MTGVAGLMILALLAAACAPAAAQPVGGGPVLAPDGAMPQPALAVAAAEDAQAEGPTTASEAAVEAELPAQPPDSCPVTTAPETPFVPPAPWPATAPYAGHFWYGSAGLWTMLLDDGVWDGLAESESGYGQKVVWWADGYYWKSEPEPALTATARRLDGEAGAVRVLPATNAYHADVESFMITGMDFPTPGCWEVTGQYRDATLSYVVWIAP